MATDIRWGLGWGMYVATGFSLFVAVLGGLLLVLSPRALADSLPIFGVAILIYYMAGVLGGILVGLQRQRLDRWWIAALIGVVVALPVSLTLDFLLYGFRSVSAAYVGEVAVFAILIGPTMGVSIWLGAREGLRDRKRKAS